MSEEKALAFIAEGEKKMKKFLFFSPKYEEACDCFNKAVNQYKLLKKWTSAGDAYVKIAECQLAQSNEHEAATAYQNAANCYKKEDSDMALKYYDEAVGIYTGSGKFAQAAKLENEIATVMENDGDKEAAVEHYQKAADYYLTEESTAQAQKNLEKVATISADLDKFDKAAEIFEKLASNCLENKLLKFNAKGFLFNAGLCKLNMNDTVALRDDIERYKDMDYTFGNSRECKLVEKLIQCLDDYDVDAFTDAVYEFDQISTLDPWRTARLLNVKQFIQKAGESAVDLT